MDFQHQIEKNKDSNKFEKAIKGELNLPNLKELKINIHESFQMQEWNDGQWSSGKPIQKVYFIKQKNHEEDDIQSPRKLTMNCCVNKVLLKFLN